MILTAMRAVLSSVASVLPPMPESSELKRDGPDKKGTLFLQMGDVGFTRSPRAILTSEKLIKTGG